MNNSGRPIYAPFAPKRNQPTICTLSHAEWTPLARPRFHSVSARPEAPCLLIDVVWPPNPYPKGLPITARDSRTDCVAQFDHGSNKSILQHPRNNRTIWDRLTTYLSSYDDGSADCRVAGHPGQLLPQGRNIGMTITSGDVRISASSTHTHTHGYHARHIPKSRCPGP